MRANEALRAMGEAGFRSSVVTLLAEAAYAQGHFDQALRLTEEAETLAGTDDFEAQGRWRATRAKLLARRGQFPAARRLLAEAEALITPASSALTRARLLARVPPSFRTADPYRIFTGKDGST
jgi:ATP/maltotriose-dependent transcriptional regulator MalT